MRKKPEAMLILAGLLALAFHAIYEELLKATVLKWFGRFFDLSEAELMGRLTEMAVPIIATIVIIALIYRFVKQQMRSEAIDPVLASQQETIASLTERLKPRINAFLDARANGVTEAPTERVITGQFGRLATKGPSSKWIQVCVSCATDAPLVDCEVWLAGARSMLGNGKFGPELVEEHINCLWSQIETIKTTIHPKRVQRINLFSFYEDGQPVRPWTQPLKITLTNAIQRPGEYQLDMIFTASGAPSEERSYILRWASFSDITLRPAR
jgi:hypothetical protein